MKGTPLKLLYFPDEAIPDFCGEKAKYTTQEVSI